MWLKEYYFFLNMVFLGIKKTAKWRFYEIKQIYFVYGILRETFLISTLIKY
jgi:hypothetical protein